MFATPRLDAYLEQAKSFDEDPSKPLPSVDEDEKQELTADPLASIVGALSYYIQTTIHILGYLFEGHGWPSSTISETPPKDNADRAMLIDTLQDWKTERHKEIIKSGTVESTPGVLRLMDEAKAVTCVQNFKLMGFCLFQTTCVQNAVCIQNVSYVQNVLDPLIPALLADKKRKFIFAFFQQWWRDQSKAVQSITKQFVSTSQLELINGAYCMDNEAASYYIDKIDQTTLGHWFIKEKFVVTPRVGWQIDPFGHSAVQAYLLGQRLDLTLFSSAKLTTKTEISEKMRRALRLSGRALRVLVHLHR
ncbi:putative alpha-mannosidase [Camellia lanceoleosa]|uniref:Alpha-mannosidase n=1 Tax=Camellia lanceoleosa TaxID=1840588 RepID=A0ACC0HET5_9ERIC|nr:putative alpha-mannosidase [Camellia lanceoleosa]